MRVELSAAATADLEQIGTWLSENAGSTSLAVIRNLRRACASLADMPLRFSLVPGHEKSGLRRRVIGNYVVFYCVVADAVSVVRILHGAQDFEQLLFNPD